MQMHPGAYKDAGMDASEEGRWIGGSSQQVMVENEWPVSPPNEHACEIPPIHRPFSAACHDNPVQSFAIGQPCFLRVSPCLRASVVHG
jgi:hypothetical protein